MLYIGGAHKEMSHHSMGRLEYQSFHPETNAHWYCGCLLITEGASKFIQKEIQDGSLDVECHFNRFSARLYDKMVILGTHHEEQLFVKDQRIFFASDNRIGLGNRSLYIIRIAQLSWNTWTQDLCLVARVIHTAENTFMRVGLTWSSYWPHELQDSFVWPEKTETTII
jgi:hypothetical protein